MTSTPAPTVFGNVSLGYVVVETEKFSDWRRFGREAIGMHVDDALSDVLRFRLDDHACRFLLQRGPAEDTIALGWQLDDHGSFEKVLARVTAHGVPVTEGTAEDAELRGVERLARFAGPNGLNQEIFTRPRIADTPLRAAVRGGFVTGAAGIGHVAVTTKRPQQMRGYYASVFDARLSDHIDETISGVKVKIRFLRVNERHHSVAIAAVNRLPINPIRTRVQHVNIQVAELDDMTESYQRVKQSGFGMALGIGQHTNDRELSFYAKTPSGFEWEVGWNPLVVDEATWEPATYQGISIWGHTPEGQTVIDKLRQFGAGAASLLRREDVVGALSGTGMPDR
ncbi:VOC family protein [Mycolicibacter minnesotensis]